MYPLTLYCVSLYTDQQLMKMLDSLKQHTSVTPILITLSGPGN